MNPASLVSNTIYFLVAGVMLSYLAGTVLKTRERLVSGLITLISLTAGLISFSQVLPLLLNSGEIAFNGIIFWHINITGWIVAETGLILTLAVNIYSLSYMEEDTGTSKFFPLLVLLIISVIGLAFSSDLFNIYLFFELLAVTSFTLVAFRKDEWDPVEAGIKFLVMSATGSALILLGIAFLFKDFGTMDLKILSQAASASPDKAAIWFPLACFIIGFGIKAAIFPLHTWLPDAHAEAPSGISAMLSGIVIEAGFYVLYRILAGLGASINWGFVLIIFALFTMTAGNLMALTQKYLKRMLAYSSVAQIGYILLGIGIGVTYHVESGLTGGIFHIVTHAFMKGLAFLCAGALIYRLGSGNLEDIKGAGWKMPVTAVSFVIAVLALAGVPPLSGFMSKLLIYKSGIQSGTTLGWTASMIAIFNSVLSLGYYLPAASALFSREPSAAASNAREVPAAMTLSMLILAIITIYLGILPDPVRYWIQLGF